MDAAPGNANRHEPVSRKTVCWRCIRLKSAACASKSASRAAPSACMGPGSSETAACNHARCHEQEGEFHGRRIELVAPKHTCPAPEGRTGQHRMPVARPRNEWHVRPVPTQPRAYPRPGLDGRVPCVQDLPYTAQTPWQRRLR